MHSILEALTSSHLPAVLTDESGQDTSEYAVLIGLVALAVITTVMLLGETIFSVFADIGSSLTLQ
jgi:Flp pilus assembly pilin Flp